MMKLDETNICQSKRLRFCEVIRSWLSFIITVPVSRPLIKMSVTKGDRLPSGGLRVQIK